MSGVCGVCVGGGMDNHYVHVHAGVSLTFQVMYFWGIYLFKAFFVDM